MELKLRDKAVVITGGSRGIGFACAKAFMAEGARVGIVSRTRESLDRACAELGSAAGSCSDLVDPNSAERAIEELEATLGPIDILVNSAGAARQTAPDDLTPKHWRDAMDAKFFSYINVIDVVVKKMAARQAGVIVNIIGAGGKVASPTHLPGGSANAALMLATAGLAQAYAPRGIRVVGINPGLTDTDRVAGAMQAQASAKGISVEDARRQSLDRIPLGRIATPEEIAAAVLFLASDQASYITGVNISMDGAQVATVV